MKEKRKIIMTIILLLSVICVTVGITFAAFTFVKQGTVENTIETGTVALTYTEGKTGIILEDALPISDDAGKILTGVNNVFDFTVTATLGNPTPIGYEVTAVKIPITDMEPLLDTEVKLYLERAIEPETAYTEIMAPTNFIPIENETEIGSPKGSMILDQGNFTNQGTTIHHYRLRMWVDEDTEITEVQKKYGIKINVYAKQGVLVQTATEESCFVFDDATGTITDYNETDSNGNACPKDVVIPRTFDGVNTTIIGENAFASKGITSINIPNSVTTIGGFAFMFNQLTTISLPDNLLNLGDGAFAINKLTNVVFSNKIKKIGDRVFEKNSLTSVEIPNNISSIGKLSFARNQLIEVNLPNYLESIGDGAFSYNQLTGLIIPNTITTIGEEAFHWNKLTSVEIPKSVTTIGISAFSNNQLPDNQAFIYNRNTDGSINYSSLNSYGGVKKDNLIIPDNITTIGKSAFSGCEITSITIPNGVVSIEDSAFIANQLTSVEIPDSVTTIGEYAFDNNQLTTVTIGTGVTTIGKSAFLKNSSRNINLEKIVNKTGRSFDWQTITGSSSAATFVTGTISHSLGNIIVTDTE